MRLNRKQLRRLIKESINELTLIQSEKVVELEISSAFFFRHPDLEGGEIMVDEPGEVAGVLVALKGMGYTHVMDISGAMGKQEITIAIKIFDEHEERYTDHYPEAMSGLPMPHNTLLDDPTTPNPRKFARGPNNTRFYDYRD